MQGSCRPSLNDVLPSSAAHLPLPPLRTHPAWGVCYPPQTLPPQGRRVQVALPPRSVMDSYGGVHVRLRLDCEGPLDRDCPYW